MGSLSQPARASNKISLLEHIQNQLSLVGFSRKQTEKLRFLSRGEWRTLAEVAPVSGEGRKDQAEKKVERAVWLQLQVTEDPMEGSEAGMALCDIPD